MILHIDVTKKPFILECIGENNDNKNTGIVWLKYYVYTERCQGKHFIVLAAVSHLKLHIKTHFLEE